jgi:hypothetical protein
VRRAYLLLYSADIGDRAFVKKWVQESPLVLTWRYDLPNCFYVISEASAQDLCDSFRAYTGPKGRFMFMEASDNRQGFLPADTWYLLRNKSVQPARK